MSPAIRVLFIVAGAGMLGLFFYKLIAPVGHWYELNFAKNDDDLSRAYMVALAIQLGALPAGGWLGDRLFRKRQQKRLGRR
ncbi:hypothetical protein ABIC33_006257 [Variovorax sp. 1140]|uniref:hypothetical protein n=1 Tax=Variovorax atrisoli TaxID=3394203 RepID=UPI0033933EA2